MEEPKRTGKQLSKTKAASSKHTRSHRFEREYTRHVVRGNRVAIHIILSERSNKT